MSLDNSLWILKVSVFAVCMFVTISSEAAWGQSQYRFTAKGPAMIDHETGLTWQKKDDGRKRTWTDALKFCQSLKLGGAGGWRLPSVDQLSGIVDQSSYFPTVNLKAFPGTASDGYWTSSSSKVVPRLALSVDFSNGGIVDSDRAKAFYTRCVRTDE